MNLFWSNIGISQTPFYIERMENAIFIFTSGNNDEEFTSKEILYDCAKNVIPEEKIEMMDLEKALRTVIKEGQLTFVIGSFHMYKLVRDILQKR